MCVNLVTFDIRRKELSRAHPRVSVIWGYYLLSFRIWQMKLVWHRA